ncbi:MAG TPA: hypothetical protein VE153_02995 [Myxococcus sp.]|nr:hypothetical protein [Myxococcus sp.]
MRNPAALPTALLALMLLAHPSWAQEGGGLGLDLSGETAPQEEGAGMGLDLREDDPKAALMPRFVLLGLDTPERAGAQQAARWLQVLAGGALSSGRVTLGATVQETRERLEAGHETALRCTEVACLSEPADALDADLLTTARLSLEDAGWTLRTWTYDRDRRVVHADVVSGRNPRDAAFQKEAAAKLSGRMMALARPRAVLKVSVNVPTAVVKVGERILGVGSVEARLPPGISHLEVTADEYGTFARSVDLKPGATEAVDVRLEISGPAPEGPGGEAVAGVSGRAGGTPIYKRPAFYTALVGLAAVGAGVVLGLGAKDVESRAGDADGDGIFDISRKERLDAQSQANLATALIAGGGVAAAGSAAWLVLVPARGAPAPASVTAGGGGGPSTVLHLVVGGSF